MDPTLSHPTPSLADAPPRPADNPFSVQKIESLLDFRPEWSGLDRDALMARVLEGVGPLAITGRHGAGKTTLLDMLLREVESRGHPVVRMFFNADDRDLAGQIERLPGVSDGLFVGIDGDEHLGWRERRQLWRRLSGARRVLLARHRAARFPVLVRLAPSPPLLHVCVQTLSPEWYTILAPELDAMFRHEHGNLRECLWRCYDRAGGR